MWRVRLTEWLRAACTAAALACLLCACAAPEETGRESADNSAPEMQCPEPSSSSTGEPFVEPVEEKPEGLSKKLPFVGLSETWIDQTWLGKHDESKNLPAEGAFDARTIYYWNADNGTGDRVFSAQVENGEVTRVSKYNQRTDYWQDPDDPSLLGNDFPNMKGTGRPVHVEPSEPMLPDPSDYANAEVYADAAEGYFEYHGSSDPWGDAVEHWEENGPA